MEFWLGAEEFESLVFSSCCEALLSVNWLVVRLEISEVPASEAGATSAEEDDLAADLSLRFD